MSVRATFAVASRMLRQLRRDHRTIALVMGVPSMLLILLHYVFTEQPAVFDNIGGPLVGVFPFTMMFVVTSIAMLRERTGGTLERLMSLPIGKADLLFGYGIAFAVLGIVQSFVTSTVAFWILNVPIAGSLWLVIVIAIGNSVLGMALGLFLSAFARTEFQAVQFMPAVVFPQLLLCGIFVPRDHMAHALEVASRFLPMTYAFDALDRAVVKGESLGSAQLVTDVVVVLSVALGALTCGALTLRRRTP